MSKLSEIEARNRETELYPPPITDAEKDRRYLLGLLAEVRRVVKNVRNSQESDLAVYSRWVGEQMTDLLQILE